MLPHTSLRVKGMGTRVILHIDIPFFALSEIVLQNLYANLCIGTKRALCAFLLLFCQVSQTHKTQH